MSSLITYFFVVDPITSELSYNTIYENAFVTLRALGNYSVGNTSIKFSGITNGSLPASGSLNFSLSNPPLFIGPSTIIYTSFSTVSNPKWQNTTALTYTAATNPFVTSVNFLGKMYYTPTDYIFGPSLYTPYIETNTFFNSNFVFNAVAYASFRSTLIRFIQITVIITITVIAVGILLIIFGPAVGQAKLIIGNPPTAPIRPFVPHPPIVNGPTPQLSNIPPKMVPRNPANPVPKIIETIDYIPGVKVGPYDPFAVPTFGAVFAGSPVLGAIYDLAVTFWLAW